MTKAVRVHKVGGPEVLTYESVDVPAPGPGEVRIRQHAVGLNFIDVYFRTGLYKAPGLPFIAGNEAAGEVIAVGPGVTNFHPGDRVAYYFNLGGYASERNIPWDKLVKLPDHITYEQGAVLMLKGLTVWYLLFKTFKVEPGHRVLIHAAAGGIGLLACQWAKALGVTVIGTVGSDEKAELARAHGARVSGGVTTHLPVVIEQLPTHLDGDYDVRMELDLGATGELGGPREQRVQRRVLCGRKRLHGIAFDFDADRVVVARVSTVPAGDAGLPGTIIAAHKLLQ